MVADRLAPWKLPSRGRMYVEVPLDLAGDGFVSAPLEEATLILCVLRDPTLRCIAPAVLPREPGAPVLTDAAICYWDVLVSDDIDSGEAAARIKALVIGSNR